MENVYRNVYARCMGWIDGTEFNHWLNETHWPNKIYQNVVSFAREMLKIFAQTFIRSAWMHLLTGPNTQFYGFNAIFYAHLLMLSLHICQANCLVCNNSMHTHKQFTERQQEDTRTLTSTCTARILEQYLRWHEAHRCKNETIPNKYHKRNSMFDAFLWNSLQSVSKSFVYHPLKYQL